MSAGPIKQWREGHRRPKQIPVSERVHAPGSVKGKGYCGTNEAKHVTADPALISCPNCLAARRADEGSAA